MLGTGRIQQLSGVVVDGNCCHMSGGGYTSTNPESRRVVPDNINGRVKVKVVYVVLEAQYQSSLTTAVKRINATKDEVKSQCGPSLVDRILGEYNRECVEWACLMVRGSIPGHGGC